MIDGLKDAATFIAEECDALKALLLEKNKAYGNSALDPLRIASKASAEEQILVRIDDKLSRLARGSSAGEDVWKDLLGYIILLRVARKMEVAGQKLFIQSPITGEEQKILREARFGCDDPTCRNPVAFHCKCARCSREPEAAERFRTCRVHVHEITTKHEQVRGRPPEWT